MLIKIFNKLLYFQKNNEKFIKTFFENNKIIVFEFTNNLDLYYDNESEIGITYDYNNNYCKVAFIDSENTNYDNIGNTNYDDIVKSNFTTKQFNISVIALKRLVETPRYGMTVQVF
jgi:hypothetical protein